MTYEYLCTACGHAWEAEQSISADALKTCPHCHEETARRQVSGGAGFILKGGGWYADLYGSSPKKSGGEDAKPAATTASASPAKTETAVSDSGSKGTDQGSSGSSGSSSSGSSGSSGTPATPASSTPSGSKATGAGSGA